MTLSTVLDLLILGALAVGAAVWQLARKGGDRYAEELVERAIEPSVLARELARVRGGERQELRFVAYGELWARMKPLALYADDPVTRSSMQALSRSLTDWYFSATGGLMLTVHNRELYFALQDLVHDVGAAEEDWRASRIVDPRPVFDAVLDRHGLVGARALQEHLATAVGPRDWPDERLGELVGAWRRDVRTLSTAWKALAGDERFAVLQQVSSVLRTGLANDVDSRLR